MSSAPTLVHFSTIHAAWPWFRQTPNNNGVWEDFRFQLEDEKNETEWLVVFDEPTPSLKTTTPYERRILFVTEPPEMKNYKADFVNQFQFMVSPYALPGFRGHHLQQQSALNWQYGIDQSRPPPHPSALDWSALSADKPKSKLVSVICSNKTRLPAHRRRLAFVELLKQRLGDRVDVFGRGMREISDKQEAIAAYKFHIVLENNDVDHFWTEKLADAYLGDAFPIFAGCANLDIYFDRDSFRRIDICNPDRGVDDVERIINSNLWSDQRELIREARRRVMFKYNYVAVTAKIIRSSDGASKSVVRTPPTAIRPLSIDRVKVFRRKLYGLLGIKSRRNGQKK
jgi:hypothetical protein